LAIYKTLSTEAPVPSAESEVEADYAELDSGKELTETVAHSDSKHKAEEAAGQTITEPADSF